MPYQCTACPSLCRREFLGVAAWRSHETRCIIHTRAPMYICEVDPHNCSLGFSFASSYINHLWTAHETSVIDPKHLDMIRIGQYCDRFYCGFCRSVYPTYLQAYHNSWTASRMHHIQGHFEGRDGQVRHVREWSQLINSDWNGWPIPAWLQAYHLPDQSMILTQSSSAGTLEGQSINPSLVMSQEPPAQPPATTSQAP